MMHPENARYLSLALLLFALAAVATCSPGCSCGDDDDGYDCDHGQGTRVDGVLRSPVEECIADGGKLSACIIDNEDDEIEWVCSCRPDKCEDTKSFYEKLP